MHLLPQTSPQNRILRWKRKAHVLPRQPLLPEGFFLFPEDPPEGLPWVFSLPDRYISLGFFKKSTISFTSIFASSSPATSLKSILTLVFLSKICALDFPTLKIFAAPPPPVPPLILLNINSQITTRSAIGIIQLRISPK